MYRLINVTDGKMERKIRELRMIITHYDSSSPVCKILYLSSQSYVNLTLYKNSFSLFFHLLHKSAPLLTSLDPSLVHINEHIFLR